MLGACHPIDPAHSHYNVQSLALQIQVSDQGRERVLATDEGIGAHFLHRDDHCDEFQAGVEHHRAQLL